MSTNDQIKLDSYFNNRVVDPAYYESYQIPRYLKPVIPTDKNIKVLDIGCGYGQFLSKLKEEGYTHLMGIDISNEAINECRKKGLSVTQVNDIREYVVTGSEKFDFIIMSHVLEHIDKDKIIDTLRYIKMNLLAPGGSFTLMVPNAQSFTGTYWRYEDFTHTILFTAGSCIYVLKSAGFETISFIDADGTSLMSFWKKPIIKLMLFIYKFREDFWGMILQTSYHKPSPRIYSFELKVIAK
ncbi:MAG: class I SAM-dependent methyltransferase [Bacteroidia bacterium]|nr:class I SAM-dependent methyltransferase [Bacteroidia bacterium]